MPRRDISKKCSNLVVCLFSPVGLERNLAREFGARSWGVCYLVILIAAYGVLMPFARPSYIHEG